MPVISVKQLKKYYQIHQKEPGVAGAMKALFVRKYETAKAVDDITFSIEQGELVGFIGPNGAGKTTTLKCLTGLLHPTSGVVDVLGYTPFERKHAYLKKISLVMGQKNQLWWDLPAMDSFMLNKEIYGVSDRTFRSTVQDLADLLEINDCLHVQVRKLSLGQRMKCELVAALIHTPSVLFLDEPTIGLDVVMQQKLRDFIKQYNHKYNATVILTSHYMKDVEQLCARVLIIDHGKLLYDGGLANIVKKYTKEKWITAFFNETISKEELVKFGKIVQREGNRIVLAVPRERSSAVASSLLSNHRVEDINIEDVGIEEIIRDVFTTNKR